MQKSRKMWVPNKYIGKSQRNENGGKHRTWKGPIDCWLSCFSPRILPFTLIPSPPWNPNSEREIYLSNKSMPLSSLLSLVDLWFCLLSLYFQIFLLRVFLKVKQKFRISGIFRVVRRVMLAATSICKFRFPTEACSVCKSTTLETGNWLWFHQTTREEPSQVSEQVKGEL